MKTSEVIFLVIGIIGGLLGTALFWSIHWLFGLLFAIFIAGIIWWYLNLKKKGSDYLQSLAKRLKVNFVSGAAGYGRLTGKYKGRDIEISINHDYEAMRGVGGLALSTAFMDSSMGVLAGMENFTSVKISHSIPLDEPCEIGSDIHLDENVALFLPPSNAVTGLPAISVSQFVKKIDHVVKTLKQREEK